MAFNNDKVWYYDAGNMSSTGYYATAVWAANHAYAAGARVRQLATPAEGSERIFICTIAGTSHLTTEPTWTITRGAKTTDNTVTWVECTGQPALNGDTTNAIVWLTLKNTAVSIGQFIYDSVSASIQVCTTAGTAGNGSAPSFSATAGTTTADNTVTWTSCGLASGFAAWSTPFGRFSNIGVTNFLISGIQTTMYVAHSSAETRVSNTLINNLGSKFDTPLYVLCVNKAGSMPPSLPTDLRTTASLIHTVNGVMNFTNTNSLYVYGMLLASRGISNWGSGDITQYYRYEKCVFRNDNPGAGNNYMQGATSATSSVLELIDCQWANIGGTTVQAFLAPGACDFIWRNPSGIAGITGTTGATGGPGSALLRYQGIGPGGGRWLFDGLDLSKANKLLTMSAVGMSNHLIFKDCKLPAGYLLGDGMTGPGGTLDVIRSDGAATSYQLTREQAGAILTTETSITRVGGATIEGQAVSWKIANTVNNQWPFPFEAPRVTVPNQSVAQNRTLTIYGTWNNASLPNNDDIWIEVMGLVDATAPLGGTLTTGKATTWAAGAANDSDVSSWNGGGSGAGWSPFKMSVTFSSPQLQLAGQLFAIIKSAKTSGTFYIDPKPVLS